MTLVTVQQWLDWTIILCSQVAWLRKVPLCEGSDAVLVCCQAKWTVIQTPACLDDSHACDDLTIKLWLLWLSLQYRPALWALWFVLASWLQGLLPMLLLAQHWRLAQIQMERGLPKIVVRRLALVAEQQQEHHHELHYRCPCCQNLQLQTDRCLSGSESKQCWGLPWLE